MSETLLDHQARSATTKDAPQNASPQAAPQAAQTQGWQTSHRPRRLRRSEAMRALVAETQLQPEQLIAPFFVVAGQGRQEAIQALPGVSRWSVDTLLGQLERALRVGIRSALLFGVVDSSYKTPQGQAAADPQGPVAQALRAAKQHFGNDLVLMTDVCLCGYTDHGHCGLLQQQAQELVVDNDSSLAALAAMALCHAEAGADIVAPSDMMDGRVGYLRQALDNAGHSHVGILSYAVKYASAFYGPFREAAGSAPKTAEPSGDLPSPVLKDRKSYQMDRRNLREALREIALDEAEGADMLMVKPALAYLDVLAAMRQHSHLPLVAYQVSGEYAMLKAAAAAGALEESSAASESLLAMRRAGADLIITYYAIEALEQGWL